MTHPVPGSIAPALDPGTLLPEIGARRGLVAACGACCSLVARLPADVSTGDSFCCSSCGSSCGSTCRSTCCSSCCSYCCSSCHSASASTCRSPRASSCLAPRQASLRACWEHLRLIGDFEAAMRHRALRHAVEAAARLMRERALHLPLTPPCRPPRSLPALSLSRSIPEACR
ncbi:hypothetical protein [Burkholderia gladioli]|uniref:hypothetical protein n=1 Tax=Burkholderia gladioli TaxID=28095 RepID=UPI001640F7DC|nr:hypothetical protein [Burkholderia gladioli]MDC6131948.1 hypothetical protein [Burkholderia gladioli]